MRPNPEDKSSSKNPNPSNTEVNGLYAVNVHAKGNSLFTQNTKVDARSTGDNPREVSNTGNATQGVVNCRII